jgi:hypothetical protein
VAELFVRLVRWRRFEHEGGVRHDGQGARGAGREGVAGERVAHGNARQGSAGEACRRTAFRMTQRPCTDRKSRDTRIEGLEQGDAGGPTRHFEAAVIVLEKAAAGDENTIG